MQNIEYVRFYNTVEYILSSSGSDETKLKSICFQLNEMQKKLSAQHQVVADTCHKCGATQSVNWVECSECGTRR